MKRKGTKPRGNVHVLPHKPKQEIKALTPQLSIEVRQAMLEACQHVAKSYGLRVDQADGFNADLPHSFDFELKVGVPQADGSLHDPEKHLFEALAYHYGLEPSDFGREFSDQGHVFQLVGINPKRPKYPISAIRLDNGQGYKFSAAVVKALLS